MQLEKFEILHNLFMNFLLPPLCSDICFWWCHNERNCVSSPTRTPLKPQVKLPLVSVVISMVNFLRKRIMNFHVWPVSAIMHDYSTPTLPSHEALTALQVNTPTPPLLLLSLMEFDDEFLNLKILFYFIFLGNHGVGHKGDQRIKCFPLLFFPLSVLLFQIYAFCRNKLKCFGHHERASHEVLKSSEW